MLQRTVLLLSSFIDFKITAECCCEAVSVPVTKGAAYYDHRSRCVAASSAFGMLTLP